MHRTLGEHALVFRYRTVCMQYGNTWVHCLGKGRNNPDWSDYKVTHIKYKVSLWKKTVCYFSKAKGYTFFLKIWMQYKIKLECICRLFILVWLSLISQFRFSIWTELFGTDFSPAPLTLQSFCYSVWMMLLSISAQILPLILDVVLSHIWGCKQNFPRINVLWREKRLLRACLPILTCSFSQSAELYVNLHCFLYANPAS